ncbi:MAG: ABC transporter permease subunit [Solobacterium sp.]|nr:ABC transporter permease subunit [Solobacterium sp.]MBQ1356170.1 ABC transporter permease subunit [Solobacterium sp.]
MSVMEVYENRPRKLWVRILIFCTLLAAVWWSSNGITFNGIAQKGAEVASGIFHGLTHPDLKIMFGTTTEDVPFLIAQTIAIALLGTVIGGIVAIPISFLASTNVVPKGIAYIFRAVILLIRTIPSLVWALVWIRVTGPGAFCGVITQSVCSIGMISKMYITAIEDLDTGILESLDACGCTTFQKIRCGILPQLSASFISTIIYRFDINLKDATTLGIVGAGGIGASMLMAINSRRWAMVGSFLWALIILVIIIEYFSTKIRARLAHGRQ